MYFYFLTPPNWWIWTTWQNMKMHLFHESAISLLVRVHCNLLNLLVILMVLCDSLIVQSVVFSYELLEGRVQKKMRVESFLLQQLNCVVRASVLSVFK